MFTNGMLPPGDFIKSCYFGNGFMISCPEPELYFNQQRFCYTMNLNKNVVTAGPNNAFVFELDVHEDEYSSEVNSKAIGAKVDNGCGSVIMS